LLSEVAQLSPEERKAALDEEDRKRRRAELQQLTAKLAPLIEEVRKEVRALHDEYGCGPLLLRLSWSDAATYERKGGTGGPRAAMR
jgi:catalase (peroxidase I)